MNSSFRRKKVAASVLRIFYRLIQTLSSYDCPVRFPVHCVDITASHPPVFPLCTLAHFGRCGRPLATNPPVWGRAERGERGALVPPRPPRLPTLHHHHGTTAQPTWSGSGPYIGHSAPGLRAPAPGQCPHSGHTDTRLWPGWGVQWPSVQPHHHPHHQGDTGWLRSGPRRDWMQWSRPPRHIHEHSGEMLDICPEYKRLQPSVTVAYPRTTALSPRPLVKWNRDLSFGIMLL